ncbi:MAG: hypothetical protein HFH15_03170 [Ruminococcus sp.]|nr:hypothetical protein [Ruminococcus sp.]
MSLYPEDKLYRELSFISYYYHWSMEEVLSLDHRSRRRWCREISEIHREINPSEGKEKSLFELKRI